LPDVAGRAELEERLRQAVLRNRMPQSLLFYGPAGVGKQTLALWTAALLQCDQTGPCGECRSCRLAARLEHPDIHWHFPLVKPKTTGSPKKFREKLEEARLQELDRRRTHPLTVPEEDGVTGIYLAAVEEIRLQAARRPAAAQVSVFVIGDAEQMVPQRSSPWAANAFLKLLEEPPRYAYIILAAADRTARLAQGSIGHAMRLAAGQETERGSQAVSLLAAALSPKDAARHAAALSFTARGARGEFSLLLSALAGVLRDLLSVVAGAGEHALDPELARKITRKYKLSSQGLVLAMDRVEEAVLAASGNANPQAVAATLLFEMHEVLERA
jgi:DNA polymerase-3 subunit delta'